MVGTRGRALAVLGLLLTFGCTAPRPTGVHPLQARRSVSGIERRASSLAPAVVRSKPPGAPAFAAAGLPGSDVRVNQDTTLRFQNEPAIAVDPGNPQRVVAAWCDNYLFDEFWTLQLTSLAYGWSGDGGQTWQSRPIAFGNIPQDALTADPALTFDAAGNVYLVFLRYDPFDRANPALNQVWVTRSTDGGATYADPVLIDAGAMDKPWIASNGSDVYVVWNRGSDVYFSRSTDQGASFSPGLLVSSPGNHNGQVPAVGPNGEIYVVWVEHETAVWVDRSLDGGATWLPTDRLVDTLVPPRNLLAGGFRNPTLPSIAVDTSGGSYSGRVYVVWPDGRFGDPDILLAWSADQGDTWSPAARVNGDATGNDADQFFPWIAVDADGRVHVGFLDRRDDPDGLAISYHVATSTNGGATFGADVRVSDGAFPPFDFFFGDYTAVAAGPTLLYAVWPDARRIDQDVFFRGLDPADFDQDGVLDDGDNCRGAANANQADGDGDAVGDACDNCPGTPNAGQLDDDRDGLGGACDPCPARVGGVAGDPDADGVEGCTDNCPVDSNESQADADGDGAGDACDPCPASAFDDVDGDRRCGDVDNCPEDYNPLQVDVDGDGVGGVCDNCVDVANASQVDSDFDEAGDACDCPGFDFLVRKPRSIRRLELRRTPTGASLVWTNTTAADEFLVSRGLLSALGTGAYGTCLADGLGIDPLDDDTVPPAGDGFFYLVQGKDLVCGLGSLGFDSAELERINTDPSGCR